MVTKIGTPQDDQIYGTDDADYIDGGAGNDTIFGSLGRDFIYGGEGDDRFYQLDSQSPNLVNLGEGSDLIEISWFLKPAGINFNIGYSDSPKTIFGTTYVAIENWSISGSNTGNDTLTGGTFSNLLSGNGGDDRLTGGSGVTAQSYLYGNDGNDTLTGGAGGSTNGLFGGAGDDFISITPGNSFNVVQGDDGTDTLQTDYSGNSTAISLDLSPSKLGNNPLADGTKIFTVEQFIVLGTSGNDSVLAGSGNDTVRGAGGNDSLAGGAGDDSLQGGVDNDTLNGGTGNDTMSGGQGDDALYSNSNEGADSLDGGTGTDFAKIDRAQSGRAFTLDLSAPDTAQTLADGTSLVNIERIQFEAGSGNDLLTGGALNDILAGNGGNDTLNGGGGDDVLIAGRGFNQIDGGAGADVLQVTGRRADYVFSRNGDGTVTATNPSSFVPDRSGALNPEVDTFSNIETIHFADGYAKLSALVR